jgi:dolichyl-phosphate beta-glucosyltransferase
MTTRSMHGGGASIRLSVVVPCFNEAHTLRRLVGEVRKRFDMGSTEFVLVDDGSTDGSSELAGRLLGGLEHARLIELPVNRGKGAALRAGVAVTTGPSVLFMDADLSTSLENVDDFLAQLDEVDVVVGSRVMPGSETVGSPWLRVCMGRTFSVLARLLTGTGVSDSQCGFKAFRGEPARLAFALSKTNRFAFDP